MLSKRKFKYQTHNDIAEVKRNPQSFKYHIRIAWIFMIVCLIACLLSISRPVQAEIPTPGPDYKVVSLSDEQSNERWEMGHTINCYAGGGVEPMLDIMAWVTDYTGDQQPSKGVGYTFQVDHKIMPLDTIPEGFTGEVPYRFAIRIDGNIIYGGYFSEVRATVNGVGASFQNPVTSSISYSGSFSGSAEPGTTLQATLSASLWIYVSNRMTNEAQIIVDPYIYIEPTWEYAGFFGVFQSPGPNDNGVWQRVNRDWMCEFDLDSDGDIDGSDLSDYIETGSFGDLATFATKYGRTNCP